MSKGLMLVTVAALIGAVYFYNDNSFLSMLCFIVVLGAAFTTGKL